MNRQSPPHLAAIIAVLTPDPVKQPIVIGCRWTGKTIERRDTERGTFEHINPLGDGEHAGYIDLTTQRALLAPLKDAGALARIAAAFAAVRI